MSGTLKLSTGWYPTSVQRGVVTIRLGDDLVAVRPRSIVRGPG